MLIVAYELNILVMYFLAIMFLFYYYIFDFLELNIYIVSYTYKSDINKISSRFIRTTYLTEKLKMLMFIY